MRRKGISIFEQHVEKVVLGVVAFVLLAVLAVQFLGGPTRVELDRNRYTPDRAYTPLQDRARTLIGGMNNPSPELPERPAASLSLAWEEASSRPVGPTGQIAALGRARGPGAVAGMQTEEAIVLDGRYRFPVDVPAPRTVRGVSFPFTLHPREIVTHRPLADRLGGSQPFDIFAVTVEGSFSGLELREMFRTDPEPENPETAAIPREWWDNNIAVMRVEVERADGLDENGEPINLVSLDHIPGREAPLEAIGDRTLGSEEHQERIRDAEAFAGRIMRPNFYRAAAGEPWMPPSGFELLASIQENASQIQRRVRELERIRDDIRRAERDLEAQRDAPRTGGQAEQERRRQLEERIQTLQTQEQRAIIEMEREFHVDERGRALPIRPAQLSAADALLLDNADVKAWAHDIDVVPGRSYIYRMRVVINNPLFGQRARLHDDQRQLATQPELAGRWSQWSQPVQVDREAYFFVTSATEGDQTGAGPSAQIEVFGYFYGYWRRARMSIQPGDRIVGTFELPDPTTMPIFDLAAFEPDRPEPGRRPGGFEPPGQDGPAILPAGELPPNAEPGPTTLPVELDTMLLDVAGSPGSGSGAERRLQAFLQDSDGRIVVRMVGRDTASQLYRRLRESSELGRLQGQIPEEPEPEPEPQREPEPEPRRERPTRDAGGGSAGGG